MKKTLFGVSLWTVFLVACVSEEEFNNLLNNENAVVAVTETDQVDDTPVDSVDIDLMHEGDSVVWDAVDFKIGGSAIHATCRLDDKITLRSDGTYVFDGGTDFCGLEDNTRIVTGTWEVSDDNQSLVFDRLTDREFTTVVVNQTEDEIELTGNYTLMGVSFDLRGVYRKL